jgi:DNA polymerase-3 subunit epsilon
MFCLKLNRPLVVFDIESTGVSPRKDRIIELAAIKVFPDGREEEKCWLLNPTIPIPPETTAIHGITDEMVRDCFTFEEKAEEIFEFFRDCELSGFNADRFDIPCLEEEFARVGMNFASSMRLHIDVQRIFHKKEPRDLTAAVKYYLSRPHDGAHGAEADTRATLEVLKAQMQKYNDLPQTAEEMDEFLMPHDPLNADRAGLIRWKDGCWTINFGKKKGESLKKLLLDEPNFLKWMLKGDFDTEARMIIKDLLDNGRLPPEPKM